MDLYGGLDLYADLPPACGESVTPTMASGLKYGETKNASKGPQRSALAFRPRQAITSLAPKVGIDPAQNIQSKLQLTGVESNRSREEELGYNMGGSSQTTSFDVEDPYDPMNPNDYFAFCEERLEARRQIKLEEENMKRLSELERIRSQKEKERAQAIVDGNIQKIEESMSAGRGRGRGSMSNLPSWMTKDINHDKSDHVEEESHFGVSTSYRSGEGLGKDDQGTLSSGGLKAIGSQDQASGDDQARVLERTTKRSMNALPLRKQPLFSNPTCVVLLKNMAAPGEVDCSLCEETKSECSKYGKVTGCMSFEVDSSSCPPNEVVRVFVKFERQESAVRAYRDLNGRFFAGRQISASFYSEEKFEAKELAPYDGEW